jgi:biopolymer transport protein ExbD
MAAVKMKRNHPAMDMTAMCDVAFLLLTFFILTAQFKSQDAATIETPSSISAIPVPDKDIMVLSIDKEGKAYFGIDNQQMRVAMLENMAAAEGVTFTDKEKKTFALQANFGLPFNQLKSFLNLPPEQMKAYKQPGMPVDSTAQNDMVKWIYNARKANNGLRIAIKGDNVSKFPAFKNVMTALQVQNINKFNLITGGEQPPAGWVADTDK